MRAVIVRWKPVSVLAAKTLGRVSDWFLLGPLAPTRLADVPEPTLPGDRWVRLEVIQCGICGADVATVTFRRPGTSFLGAMASFPIGLGHEIVGRVVGCGGKVTRLKLGDRVTVEPFLSCVPRGIDPVCPNCARGNTTACDHLNIGGDLPRGVHIGINNFTGGGWGERLVAHEESCYPLPDTLSDDAGVMVEPFGAALHAVNRRLPAGGETVLVLGAGTMGLMSVLAVRALGSKARVLCAARHDHQAELARELGADLVLRERGPALYDRVARETGAEVHKALIRKSRVLAGGVDVVIDATGTARTLTDSVALARGRGTVILVGTGDARGFDPAAVWFKELTLHGCMGHGMETHAGERVKGFELAIRLALERQGELERLVTHHFRLDDWTGAIRTCLDRRRTRAVKVVLQP